MSKQTFWIYQKPQSRNLSNTADLFWAAKVRPQNPGWIEVVDKASYDKLVKVLKYAHEQLDGNWKLHEVLEDLGEI